ncbi:MAG: helix-turn-helix domain-containing protein [Nanoarchaeota archaeon]|nr:helix-turn-helix domain-containing protein [Nanoarchaeota archaeon]
MDKIKESFQRVKEDIDSLYSELSSLRTEIEQTNTSLSEIYHLLDKISPKLGPQDNTLSSTHNQRNSTNPTHSSTHNLPLSSLNSQKSSFSTGNEGVPADRQTNRQTNRQQENRAQTDESANDEIPSSPSHLNNSSLNPQGAGPTYSPIEDAAKMLNSLDNLKKEIRLKFKRLTDQEIVVFSTLYQLDEETGPTDYRTIAARLNLTESSIRDYIARLIKKGIPVDKKKKNNKLILLSISECLK